MKRVLSSLASVLVLTAALAVTAQAQDYPSGTTAQQQPTTTTEPQPTTTTDASTSTTTSSTEMPATASPLALMGLGGLASLAAGAWFSRRRRND